MSRGIALIGLIGLATVTRGEIVTRDTLRQIVQPDSARFERIDVDNLSGSVEIVGSDRQDVAITAVRRIRAVTSSHTARAGRNVQLLVRSFAGRLVVFVDAPWRIRHGVMGRRLDRFGFDVSYDLRIEVPSGVGVTVQTRDDGSVSVRGVTGDIAAANTNGNLSVSGVRSPASLSTVNGDLTVTYDVVPQDDCDFSTVNGEIDVSFPSALNAVLAVSTMHGDIFTEFPFTPLPRQPVRVEEENGWRRYRGQASTRVAVGTPGPELRFHTLNGPITIRKRDH